MKKIPAILSAYRDLSPTAREIILTPSEPFPFVAGSFINLFITHEGKTLRRAFSLSSSDRNPDTLSVSVRLSPQGAVTPLFWQESLIGTHVEIMGPLGLNTADKMHHRRVFLFGFGVGAGVVKSLVHHFTETKSVDELTIMTGSRADDDILHKDYFDRCAHTYPFAHLSYVVSQPQPDSPYKKGYMQEHLGGMDFSNADVYVCGQTVACDALIAEVKKTNPTDCTFFVEAFH